MKLEDVFWPTTPATGAVREVVTAYSSPALANQCVRSYVWAASYAQLHDIGFDAELLYVAAMLHDIALVPEFDSHGWPSRTPAGTSAGSSVRAPAGRSSAGSGCKTPPCDTCETRSR